MINTNTHEQVVVVNFFLFETMNRRHKLDINFGLCVHYCRQNTFNLIWCNKEGFLETRYFWEYGNIILDPIRFVPLVVS